MSYFLINILCSQHLLEIIKFRTVSFFFLLVFPLFCSWTTLDGNINVFLFHTHKMTNNSLRTGKKSPNYFTSIVVSEVVSPTITSVIYFLAEHTCKKNRDISRFQVKTHCDIHTQRGKT